MKIFLEYSWWFFPLCLAVGFAVAWFLYAKDSKLHDAPRWVRRLLLILRGMTISFCLFLLLGPFVERRTRKVEKPTIVLVQDNSASVVSTKDSVYYKTKYLSDYKEFAGRLREKYEVDEYCFGESLSNDTVRFDEKMTNISAAIQDVATRYYNQNLGAVVLATDGIYNEGENPKYSLQNLEANVPIYTVALGDTVQNRDNVVSQVLHNKIAFRDNPFVIRVSAESHLFKGVESKLMVKDGETVVYETVLRPSDDHLYKTVDCKLVSKTVGRKIYTVSVEYHDGEVSASNNEYVFAVDVLESRKQILILYEAVHPDVAAIRRAIESNKNFESSVMCLADGKSYDLSAYNCVVMVGLPTSSGKGKTVLNEALEKKIPCFVVCNQSTSFEVLNSLNAGLEISNRRGSNDEVRPVLEQDFSLFVLDENSKNLLAQVPPLYVPYGNYSTGVQTRVLCSQMLGNIAVERPLILFSQVQNTKVGVVVGEGIWRWRMFDKNLNDSFDAFDSFVNKMITYLALSEKRELFSVSAESIVSDNQSVTFTAELYDKSYEPLTDQTISMLIRNGEGVEYPYTFSSNDNFYLLNAGRLPQGSYTYVAKVSVDGTELRSSGSFSVLPLQIEFKQTRANHAVLADLSLETGGKLFFPSQFDLLYDEIVENQNIVPISHFLKKRRLVVDLPLILLWLVLMASAEWFLRKYYASY